MLLELNLKLATSSIIQDTLRVHNRPVVHMLMRFGEGMRLQLD